MLVIANCQRWAGGICLAPEAWGDINSLNAQRAWRVGSLNQDGGEGLSRCIPRHWDGVAFLSGYQDILQFPGATLTSQPGEGLNETQLGGEISDSFLLTNSLIPTDFNGREINP